MSNLVKNTLAGIADFALYFFLWLYLGIPWYFAFFISTLVVIGLWWVLAWIISWTSYRTL